MEKPALELVLRALDALYHCDDALEKERASQWLTQLQASVHGWEVADQLLVLQRDIETSYFAAQTMQSKVRHCFAELPPDTHVALRDSLLNHMQNLCAAPVQITRQLAMALADLALQMSDWSSVVHDVIQRYSSDLTAISVLLDILIILPEEIGNRSLRLGQNRRREWRLMFGESCTEVLTLLQACLSSCPNSHDITTKVFACLGSWVQLGNFPEKELAQSSLMAAPFRTLHLPEVPFKLLEAATDCICSAVYVCEDQPKLGTLGLALKREIEQLLPVYQAAVLSEDTNRAYSLCRIFTELVESFLHLTVHSPGSALGDVTMYSLLLECVAHPDYEIADITFNVWYRLSEELVKAGASLAERFKPYVQKLIGHLCTHCQLDEDTSPLTVPEDDEFDDFRKNVVELLRDVIFVVGSLHCFSELYARSCRPGTPWNVSEACIFVMHAVAPSIRTDESEVLPIAVPVLLSIAPDTHYAIRATTLRLVAELGDWLDKHPDMLELVLQFLLDGLRISPVANYAARAVQSVCEKCRGRMVTHFQGLVQILEAADALHIRNEAIVGLLKGAADVLSRMPHDQIGSGISSLCMLQARPLSELVHGSSQVQSGMYSDPCVWLDRLSAIFRACQVELEEGEAHPCQRAGEEVFPILCSVCTKHQMDQRIIERACRCIRFLVRCLGRSAASVLSPLVSMVVAVYAAHQHSCFLYLGSVVVDEFGALEAFQPGLLGMLEAFAGVTFPILAAPGGLVQHPDTVDDMYRLCARFLQRCPMPMLASAATPTILQCALAASSLHHRDAFTSVMKFFRDLLRLPSEQDVAEAERQVRLQALTTFLEQHGQEFVDGLVTGFVTLPSFMLAESTEVLWAFIKFSKELACHLLQVSLDKLAQTDHSKVTPEQQQYFISSVASCCDLEELYPAVKALGRLFR